MRTSTLVVERAAMATSAASFMTDACPAAGRQQHAGDPEIHRPEQQDQPTRPCDNERDPHQRNLPIVLQRTDPAP